MALHPGLATGLLCIGSTFTPAQLTLQKLVRVFGPSAALDVATQTTRCCCCCSGPPLEHQTGSNRRPRLITCSARWGSTNTPLTLSYKAKKLTGKQGRFDLIDARYLDLRDTQTHPVVPRPPLNHHIHTLPPTRAMPSTPFQPAGPVKGIEGG
jgi:hypothetical protein